MQDWSLEKLHKDREFWVAALIVVLAALDFDQTLLNSLLVFLGGRMAVRTGAVISAGRESAASDTVVDDPYATDDDEGFDRGSRHPEVVEVLEVQDSHDKTQGIHPQLEEFPVEGEEEFTGGLD